MNATNASEDIIKKMKNQTIRGIVAAFSMVLIVSVLKAIENRDPLGSLNYIIIVLAMTLAWTAQYFLFKKTVIKSLKKWDLLA